MFGSTSSAFGAANKPFGATASPFGSTQQNNSSPFGMNNNNNQTGGVFGSNTGGAFGSTGGNAFGSNAMNNSTAMNNNTQGAGLFGMNNNNNNVNNSSPFGQANNAQQPMFGNNPLSTGSMGSNSGTSIKPFTEYQEKDNTTGTMNHFQSITCMPEYRNFSFEELRFQDYQANRKFSNNAGSAGSQFSNTGSSNAFGAGINNTQPNSSGSMFGQNSMVQNSLFGSAKSNNSFGSAFGSNTNSQFGANKPASSGLFGQSNNQQSGGLFGQNNNNTNNNNNPQSGGLFGQNNNNQQQSGGLFGQSNNNQQQSGGLFGQASNTFGQNNNQQQSGGLFGQNTNNQQQSGGLFGQNNAQQQPGGLFGSKPAAPSGGLFGSNNNTAFGVSSNSNGGGLFGQTNNNNNQQTGGLFGQNNNNTQQTGGLFGQNNTNNQQSGGLFGQTNNSQQPSGGLFGQTNNNTQQSNGLFGQNNSQHQNGGLFGAKPATSSGGLFGQNTSAPQTGGLFGSKPAATTGGLFGQNNTQQQSGGLFGSKPAASSGGLFGASAPANMTGSLFGANNTTAANNTGTTSGGLFGNTGTANTTNTLGGGGLFGNKTQTPGISSGGLFGNNSNSIGTTTSTGLFGSKPATSSGAAPLGGLFGNSAASNNTMGGGLGNGIQQNSQQQQYHPLQQNVFNQNPFGTNELFSRITISSSITEPEKASVQIVSKKKENINKSKLHLQPQPLFNRNSSVSQPMSMSRINGPVSAPTRLIGSSLVDTTENVRGSELDKAIISAKSFISDPRKTSFKTLVVNKHKQEVFDDGNSDIEIISFNKNNSGSDKESSNESIFDEVPATPISKDVNKVSNGGTQLEKLNTPVPIAPSDNEMKVNKTSEVILNDISYVDDCYFISPSLDTLSNMSLLQLRKVSNLVVGHKKFGKIEFLGSVDLSAIPLGLICDNIVKFSARSCIVEVDDTLKKTVNNGLKVRGRITLYNCYPLNKSTMEPITDANHESVKRQIKKFKEVPGTKFENYDANSGTFSFIVGEVCA